LYKFNIVLLILSFILSTIICEYKGDIWEENLRVTIYKLLNDSIPSYTQIIIDKKGIPFVQYSELNGVKASTQYNSTIISIYALDYYKLLNEGKDSTAKSKFYNCILWLQSNITYKNNYAYFEFNWQQPFYDSVAVPWTCGMTSGAALEAFTDASLLYKSQDFLNIAFKLLRGFYLPIQSGGFTYKEPEGWWYEEYAYKSMHTPRVVAGHIFAIQHLHKFWLVTKSDSAAVIVQKGLQSLKYHLSEYDNGKGWSYYDCYHKLNDEKYHKQLTGMMKDLGDSTHDKQYYEYYNKWNSQLTKPYLYRIIKERNRSGLILYFIITAILFFLIFLLNYFVMKRTAK